MFLDDTRFERKKVVIGAVMRSNPVAVDTNDGQPRSVSLREGNTREGLVSWEVVRKATATLVPSGSTAHR
jgi:hypothetical protein